MPSKIIIQPLESDRYFHIYNRGINGQKIFLDDGHYKYFLRLYNSYLRRYVDTLAYCLLPNHYHLFIKTKESKSSKYYLTVSNQFRKLFICNTQYYNLHENRIGNLCYRHFRRKIINKDNYFQNMLYYVHANPQKHGIIKDFTLYPYSSYQQMFSLRPNYVSKKMVLDIFDGSLANFKYFHTVEKDVESLEGSEEEDEKYAGMASPG